MLNVDEIQVINDVKKYLGIDMLDIDLQKCDADGLKVIRSDKHFDVKYNSRSDMFRALVLISSSFREDRASISLPRFALVQSMYLMSIARPSLVSDIF